MAKVFLYENETTGFLKLGEDIGFPNFYRYNENGERLKQQLTYVQNGTFAYPLSEEFFDEYFLVEKSNGELYALFVKDNFTPKKPDIDESGEEEQKYDTSDYEIEHVEFEPFRIETGMCGDSIYKYEPQIINGNLLTRGDNAFNFRLPVLNAMNETDAITKEEFDALTPDKITSGNIYIYEDESGEVFSCTLFTDGESVVKAFEVNLLDQFFNASSLSNYSSRVIISKTLRGKMYFNLTTQWLQINNDYISKTYAYNLLQIDIYRGKDGEFTIPGTNVTYSVYNYQQYLEPEYSLEFQATNFLDEDFDSSIPSFIDKEGYKMGTTKTYLPIDRYERKTLPYGTTILKDNETIGYMS